MEDDVNILAKLLPGEAFDRVGDACVGIALAMEFPEWTQAFYQGYRVAAENDSIEAAMMATVVEVLRRFTEENPITTANEPYEAA